MGTAQVLKALRQLGLDEHAAAFSRCEVSGWMCDLLDDDLLQHKLGVMQPQQRATFLNWVASMQLRPLPPAATAAGPMGVAKAKACRKRKRNEAEGDGEDSGCPQEGDDETDEEADVLSDNPN